MASQCNIPLYRVKCVTLTLTLPLLMLQVRAHRVWGRWRAWAGWACRDWGLGSRTRWRGDWASPGSRPPRRAPAWSLCPTSTNRYARHTQPCEPVYDSHWCCRWLNEAVGFIFMSLRPSCRSWSIFIDLVDPKYYD